MTSILEIANFEIISSLDESQVRDLHELYKKEWWTNQRSFEDVQHILENSLSIAITEKNTKTLIAYSRVITDKFRFALIFDVIVDQAYRKQKLGKMLMEAILAHPELARVARFELRCLPEMKLFYEKCGFSLPTGDFLSMIYLK